MPGLVYDAGSSGDKLTLDRSISFLHSVPAAIPQALRGIDFTPARTHDSSEDPDSLFQRGEEFRRSYMGITSTARPTSPTDGEKELGRITGEYYWGETWTRPGLDLTSRCICTMTCLAALGREGPL